jgi:fructose/tagatose bisphosphate aldolase
MQPIALGTLQLRGNGQSLSIPHYNVHNSNYFNQIFTKANKQNKPRGP